MSAGVTLVDAITVLVAEKRAVGYKYDAEARVLARFEEFNRRQFPGLDTPPHGPAHPPPPRQPIRSGIARRSRPSRWWCCRPWR